jgi:hypothetical protein
MTEGGVIGPAELLKALKRYLEESGESERSAASRIGVNRHSLRRISVNLFELSRKTFVLATYARVAARRGLSQCFANY